MGFATVPLSQKQINLESIQMVSGLFTSEGRSTFTDISPLNFESMFISLKREPLKNCDSQS